MQNPDRIAGPVAQRQAARSRSVRRADRAEDFGQAFIGLAVSEGDLVPGAEAQTLGHRLDHLVGLHHPTGVVEHQRR